MAAGTDDPLIAPLREDLSFFPAPAENGAPVWMLHDPVNGDFLRADWAHFAILKRLDRPQTFSFLMRRLQEDSTLRAAPEEVRAFLHDLMLRNLLRSRLVRAAEELRQEKARGRLPPLQWFLHHYLYFRVPLLRPDAFLERTVGKIRALISRPALLLYALLALCGAYLLSQHFDRYTDTALDFLNWRGALAFGVAVAAVKCLHEFAHAYAAKLTGNRVLAMGVAFIVLWPVPFCDVTDSWRMNSRRRRLLISAAGILCELVVAALALTLWAVCENSVLKGIFFMLSSASLAGTLLVNLNPAMRFDGYYLFCDLTGVDNLFTRSSEYLKWRYRRNWFGIERPDPEPEAGRGLRRLLTVYGVGSWIYRGFLYFGIALIVYHSFPKFIGILLFALEILIFLVRPAVQELRMLWRLRAEVRVRATGLCLGSAAALALIWAALPLPRYTGIPAVYEPARLQVVYAPLAGLLQDVPAENGRAVAPGTVLAVLSAPELEASRKEAQAAAAAAADALRLAMARPGEASRLRELREQLAGAHARLSGLRHQQEACIIRADFAGIVTGWQDTARAGAVVSRRQQLGSVAGQGAGQVKGYLDAALAGFVPTGATARFLPASGEGAVDLRLRGYSPVRERELRDSGLASTQKGEIAVQPDADGRLWIDGSYFLLAAQEEPADDASGLRPGGGQTGTLWFWSNRRSYLAALGRVLWRSLLRESGM